MQDKIFITKEELEIEFERVIRDESILQNIRFLFADFLKGCIKSCKTYNEKVYIYHELDLYSHCPNCNRTINGRPEPIENIKAKYNPCDNCYAYDEQKCKNIKCKYCCENYDNGL
jgi:hypothetical protein